MTQPIYSLDTAEISAALQSPADSLADLIRAFETIEETTDMPMPIAANVHQTLLSLQWAAAHLGRGQALTAAA